MDEMFVYVTAVVWLYFFLTASLRHSLIMLIWFVAFLCLADKYWMCFIHCRRPVIDAYMVLLRDRFFDVIGLDNK